MNAIATLEINYGFAPTRGGYRCRNDEKGHKSLELTPKEISLLKRRKATNEPVLMATRHPLFFLKLKQFLRRMI